MEETSITTRIILIVLALLLIGMFLHTLELMTLKYKGTKEVKCYDSQGSEIEELTCIKEVYCGIITTSLGWYEIK